MIDLEEIKLQPDHTGNAKRIRSARKLALKAKEKRRKRPVWVRQLQHSRKRKERK